MRGKSGPGIMGAVALLGAPLLWPVACAALDAVNIAPVTGGTQLVLYMTVPIDGRRAARTYGLRIDQTSLSPIIPSSIALGPLQRRELVNLMITPHARMQIDIGHRLTWDLRGRQFGLATRR